MTIEQITKDLKNNPDLQLNENAKKLYYNALKNTVVCPHCKCNKIGIDNWGMFSGMHDWFYYCLECDDTFITKEVQKYYGEKIELN